MSVAADYQIDNELGTLNLLDFEDLDSISLEKLQTLQELLERKTSKLSELLKDNFDSDASLIAFHRLFSKLVDCSLPELETNLNFFKILTEGDEDMENDVLAEVPAMPQYLIHQYTATVSGIQMCIDKIIDKTSSEYNDAFARWVDQRLTSFQWPLTSESSILEDPFAMTISRDTLTLISELDYLRFKKQIKSLDWPRIVSEYLFERRSSKDSSLISDLREQALFHNDCFYLADYVSSMEQTSSSTAAMLKWSLAFRNLGKQVIDAQLTQEKIILETDCKSLTSNLCEYILNVKSRFEKFIDAWYPSVLPYTTYREYMLKLQNYALENFWRSLVQLHDIAAEDCDRLYEVGNQLLNLDFKVDFDEPDNLALRAKVSTYLSLVRMSLLQICNLYRRGKLCPPLSIADLSHAIESLFAQTGARQAFLNELNEDAGDID